MNKKWIILAVVALGLIANLGVSTYVQANNSLEIGYIDFEQVFTSHPAVEEANQELQQMMQQEQMELQQKMEELDQEEDQEEMQQLQQEFQAKIREAQQQLMEDVEATVRGEIDEIREELGLDMIVDEEGVLSERDGIEKENVTEEIISRFE